MSQHPIADRQELFIVDNSNSEWNGLRYLKEWAGISTAFDIASGYFEIGALLAMEGQWQQLDRIRILMGDEVTTRTRQALLEGLKQRINTALDQSLEDEKVRNDFLVGVPAIIDAIRSGKIQCRVYAKRKFHAKAYITHARMAVVGPAALVGSSNFTLPGLTQNIELNVQLRGAGEVRQLQDWFESHWELGEDIGPEVITTIERHTVAFTPFQIYAKALQEVFEDKEQAPTSWEKSDSRMFPVLDQYQREGYWGLLKIAHQHRGAFLCDGVGLGKTFIGLALIERLIMKDRKRVVLFVPKSGRVPVWERELKNRLPELYGDFSNLAVYNHTDLTRDSDGEGGSMQEKMAKLTAMADVVIIDEAHHFRNRNADPESRYQRLFSLIGKNKTVYFLTATPVNNHLSDFLHMVELFTQREANAFSGIGIHNLPRHFHVLEKVLQRTLQGAEHGELFTDPKDAGLTLFDDRLFRELVVQRSRAYVKESQRIHGGRDVLFPMKQDPKVVGYSIRKTYGHLLGRLEKAFAKNNPLFSLAIYYPLAHWIGDPADRDSFANERQKQVVRLIRLLFLKRFESSVRAFEHSCQTLLLKLMAFVEKNINREDGREVTRWEKWRIRNEEILSHVTSRRAELFDEATSEESDLADEFADDFTPLPRELYDLAQIFDETYDDLNQVVDFIGELKDFKPEQDNKLAALITLLRSKEIKGRKVIVFTEFMATARYLRRQLDAAGFVDLYELDSASARDRADVIQDFSPYYNQFSPKQLTAVGRKEINLLVATDVLSEGLNLQDATRLINYDLHWNPVRLMQRIGRIDRRLNPAIEARMIADNPKLKAERGKIRYYNFLPPEDLDGLLNLFNRVAHKVLRISKVFGIEGRKLLTPDEEYDALRDFLHE
ncbi:MAG: DEAD/DEAH box helicase family protein, partial [Kiritimatiellales bacterium]|nr:DEAD/DEAH box helicase family protein [Kiritimatiellales bacterium]